MKNYSLLSLALVGASGITAAFIPAKKADAQNNNQADGWYQLTTASGVTDNAFTCTNTPLVGNNDRCSYTATGVAAGFSATSITNVNTHSDTEGVGDYTATGTTND